MLKRKDKILVAALTLLSLITALWIFSNSLEKADDSNERSQSVADSVQSVVDPQKNIPPSDFNAIVRKLAHFSEFALLGAQLYLLRYVLTRRLLGTSLAIPALILLLCANFDEFLQSFTSRTSSVKDVFIDFAGALSGMLLICAIISFIRMRREQVRREQVTI